VVTVIEGDGDLAPSKVLRGSWLDHQDLSGCEFLLPLGLIRVEATKNIVDLLVGLGEVALGILGLLLMIGQFGYLENLIYKTLELVAVLGLVLSLGVKNTNAIQEAFKFTRPGTVLLMMMRPINHVNRMVRLPLLVMALGWARLIRVAWLLLLSIMLRVASSARAYLLVMENIYSDLLGFFMVSFWIREESLSPFLRNIIINLSSTSGMTFLLLQKWWMYSQRDSPIF
jgi:hypothetical protein